MALGILTVARGEVITDGLGTSLFDDYAWYCGNNDSNASDPKAIARCCPMAELFDMQNVMEWTVTGQIGTSFPVALIIGIRVEQASVGC